NNRKEPKNVVCVIDGGFLSHWRGIVREINAYAERYSDQFTLKSEPIVVPGGEASKNEPQLITELHEAFDTARLCRHSYVVAIGGGAVLDMVGYAAATAHRGIRLVRVPTTVLAQNDSGVGVKNSINTFGKKNFLGTFAPPFAVLNDFNFLTTLDDRDWRSGLAEAIKVALIKDADFFESLAESASALAKRDMPAMQQAIYRCAQLHLDHIANSGDPFEMGSSRPLDFGHWAAHRLEFLTDYGLRHGEAVAIGMALDCTYSYLIGCLSEGEWKQILGVLQALGFSLYVPELDEQLDDPTHPRSLFRGLAEFREHLGGELTLVLLEEIGRGKEVHTVELDLYRQAIALLREAACAVAC
ncbi:MAG: 3-dehydroquinate synthase, partial [Cyanobacteria bacterium J06641_5]